MCPPLRSRSGRSAARKPSTGCCLSLRWSAILGLIFLVFNGATVVQDLNQQVAAALVQPTLTPTPLVQAVILPSGHTPPTAEGGARFNDAEIPEHLRPLHQSFASAPPPAARPEQAIQIVSRRLAWMRRS